MIDKLAFVAAFAFVGTLLSIPLARKVNIIDAPGPIKIHKTGMPRFGGFGVLMAVIVADAIQPIFDLPALAGVIFIWLTGSFDDRFNLKPSVKVLGQTLAGSMLGYSVLRSHAGIASIFVALSAVAAVVVMANAQNLIDGIDGLAAGTAFISFVGLSILAVTHGLSFWPASAFAAAILGFFPLNFPRARTFMGDSGSMLLGYLLVVNLAALAFANPWLLFNGALIVFFPLFDLVLGIVRRFLNHQPIFAGDRYHSYDHLGRVVGSKLVAATVIFCISALLTTAGIVLSFLGPVLMQPARS